MTADSRTIGRRSVVLAVLLAAGGLCWPVVLRAEVGLDQKDLVSRPADGLRFANPMWSPDGGRLALSDENHNRVYVVDLAEGRCLQINAGPSSGYAYQWSADGKRLGFKVLTPQPGGEGPLQTTVVFDVDAKTMMTLHGPAARVGVPSFSADGRIAFTVDEELRIADAGGAVTKTFGLGHYANLAVISPDGARVAYNDADDQIWLIDTASGEKTQVTSGEQGYFGPVWSPDSSRLAVSTLAGRLKTIEAATGATFDLDDGQRPSWTPDSRTVVYSQTQRIDGVRVVRSEVRCIGFDGSGQTVLTPEVGTYAGAARVSADGREVAYVSLETGQVQRVPLLRDERLEVPGGGLRYRLGAGTTLDGSGLSMETWEGGSAVGLTTESPQVVPTLVLTTETRVSGTVPYLHQTYDTPDDYDGNWACNASAALMGINYYGVLPYWDVTCSWPYSHVSHYGQYVSRIYTYNGYTYNIGSADPDGIIAYGGYGYIVRNDWLDTKGYMRDYIINHGLSSSVDWSPTWSELQTEVLNSNPFILLNSLTTAGHYITTIGYVQGQNTGVFNDPYGNKNLGYVNYYGTGVLYDWPGYNYGYANLNTVHCFIYCRGAPNQPPTITQHPISAVVPPGGTATLRVAATGAASLSYQWQKNQVNLSNGGHYAGATTTILTVSSFDSSDAGSYRCVVSNPYGSGTSNSATLTIGVPISTFIVESRSGGQNYANYAELSGTWADSSAKSTAPGCTSGIGSRYCIIGSTARAAEFRFTPTATGTYQVYTTNCNTTNSGNPLIHKVAHAGGTATVNVCQNSTCPSNAVNKWYMLGMYTLNTGTSYAVTLDGMISAGSIGSVGRSDAIKWEQVNINEPPTITQQPVGQEVCPEATAEFTVTATGEGTLSYRWQKNEVNLSDGGHYSGATTGTLTVSSCDSSDAASYRCVVSSEYGSRNSDAATLTVKAATGIVEQPSNRTVVAGGITHFTVQASGEGELTYQWQKDEVDLSDGGHYAGSTTAVLAISDCDSSDAASYRCVVTGGCGSLTSSAATLTILPAGQPGDFDGDSDVDLGDFSRLQQCLGLNPATSDAFCAPADLAADDVLDTGDVAAFIGCMSGADVPANANCLD